jgi:hypothetical protein
MLSWRANTTAAKRSDTVPTSASTTAPRNTGDKPSCEEVASSAAETSSAARAPSAPYRQSSLPSCPARLADHLRAILIGLRREPRGRDNAVGTGPSSPHPPPGPARSRGGYTHPFPCFYQNASHPDGQRVAKNFNNRLEKRAENPAEKGAEVGSRGETRASDISLTRNAYKIEAGWACRAEPGSGVGDVPPRSGAAPSLGGGAGHDQRSLRITVLILRIGKIFT